ncbi:uncharacterized protein THITE_2110543 [Thermothielavioides terrestris NRRL 8126]|uniref:Zn(2)-C6 fungal-type domain-containing protein n=1 Tax=Thermothielavioides terrestris (strain ATCC 38088 / NRRL 8126) TaxID=578455 RepID=G2QT82_THETT|nr:uncharacterized protein THITE_2110543 [Thermothielavioides terrestris NRRL 8126]AEO64408.1 hypothetical protein THITE_2110543 [Thermothielavioides terrestris NRRL 8126]
MDQLETQVSDLRSFLGAAPVPQQGADELRVVSPHSVAHHSAAPLRVSTHLQLSERGISSAQQTPQTQHAQHAQHAQEPQQAQQTQSQSPASTIVPSSNNAKRRADDADGAPAKQQRSKRNRYISIACNECKRRKIKCNGQTPCQRCGHLNLQCLYAPNCCANLKDSEEFRQMADQVRELQEQVSSLVSSVNSLRQETTRLAPLQDRVLPPPSVSPSSASSGRQQRTPLPFRVPTVYSGPTSMAYTVGVAKNTLLNMGYSGAAGDSHDDAAGQHEASPHASPLLAPAPSESLTQGAADPIWEFDEAEMMRVMDVYREEVDSMYPVVSLGPAIEYMKYAAAWTDSARRSGAAPPPGLEQFLSDPRTLLLKIMMCCALVVAEHGNSARAERLYDSMQPTIDKMLMTDPADVTRLPFLALCAGYRYLSNDEILGWRMMGQVARMCFELGLHRREGLLKITDRQTRRDVLHTFWSAYVLDRRWSFSTGLPFVCHDDKIDPKLPYPEDGHPFLVAMISYTRLSAKVWRMVDHFEPTVIRELKSRDFEELDREIMEWYESVQEDLKTGPLDLDRVSLPTGPHDLRRLRIWTRLRLNQVRIWLYTPVLHSATSMAENAPLARKVVDLAKQTIQLLALINSETDLYRRFQVFYHQFLTSSIAVLFLASTHAPLQFSALCRDEFYMALDLVKEMSARSFVSQRLWRTIRSLREYAPKLGLGLAEPSSFSSSSAAPAPAPAISSSLPGGGLATLAAAAPPSLPLPPPYLPGASSTQGHHGLTAPFGASGRAAGSASSLVPSPSDPQQQPQPQLAPGGPTTAAAAAAATAAATGHHHHHHQPIQTTAAAAAGDDQSNGLRLQTEMSRIYEGYMGAAYGAGGAAGAGAGAGGGAGAGAGGGAPAAMGYGGAPGHMLAGLGGDAFAAQVGDGGFYEHMRGMF